MMTPTATPPRSVTRIPGGETLGSLMQIPVSQIEPHPEQPRDDVPKAEIERLANSIGAIGQLQNVVVRELPGGGFQLIAGERRWRAAKQAGRPTIAAAVVAADDMQAIQMMVAENIEREDLNPIERAKAFELLRRPRSQGGADMAVKAIAAQMRISTSTVHRYCKFLELPDPIQKRLADGRLTVQHGVILAKYLDKPYVLKAICTDIKANPWDWVNAAEIELNAEAIDQQLSSPDPDRRAEPNTHGAPPTRNAEPRHRATQAKSKAVTGSCQTPQAEEASPGVREQTAPTDTREPLHPTSDPDRLASRVCQAMEPFRHSPKALQLIKETAAAWLDELD